MEKNIEATGEDSNPNAYVLLDTTTRVTKGSKT